MCGSGWVRNQAQGGLSSWGILSNPPRASQGSFAGIYPEEFSWEFGGLEIREQTQLGECEGVLDNSL